MKMAAAALVILSASCAGPSSNPVAIGINPWPGYETLYLAQERGFFAKHGLDVELEEYSSLGDVRRAFERGQIDGMACTMVEVLQAREQSGRQPRVVMVTDYSRGADVIVAKPGIGSVRDLNGKRVGLELASLGVYMMSRAATLHGIRLENLRLIPTDQTEVEEAARESKIDAAVTYPPASIHLRKLGWKPLFDSSRVPEEVVDVVAIDKPVLDRDPEFHRAFLAAMEDSYAYLATHRRQAVKLMAERERISVEEFEQALAGIHLIEVREMPRYLAPGGPVERVFAVLEQELRRVGQLSEARGIRDLAAHLPAEPGRTRR